MTAPLSLASLAPEPDPRQVLIRIEGLNKHYGAYHVLHDIDLQVREGERIVLCGPSGSGKSSVAPVPMRTISTASAASCSTAATSSRPAP